MSFSTTQEELDTTMLSEIHPAHKHRCQQSVGHQRLATVRTGNGERLLGGHQVIGVKEQELNRTGRHRISPLV